MTLNSAEDQERREWIEEKQAFIKTLEIRHGKSWEELCEEADRKREEAIKQLEVERQIIDMEKIDKFVAENRLIPNPTAAALKEYPEITDDILESFTPQVMSGIHAAKFYWLNNLTENEALILHYKLTGELDEKTSKLLEKHNIH